MEGGEEARLEREAEQARQMEVERQRIEKEQGAQAAEAFVDDIDDGLSTREPPTFAERNSAESLTGRFDLFTSWR